MKKRQESISSESPSMGSAQGSKARVWWGGAGRGGGCAQSLSCVRRAVTDCVIIVYNSLQNNVSF